MKVEELIDKLVRCDPNLDVSFCHVQRISESEKELDEDETWITTYGSIETVNQHEHGVCLSFVEE
ncbi:hypothetical protein [Anaerosporobacter sp.]